MAQAAAASPRTIVCYKWGTKYPADYVNRLYSMVRRHLSGSFRFVCLTDDDAGIRPEVECLPIPDLQVPEAGRRRGAWRKLLNFDAGLHDLSGTALFLDLDIVILAAIDDFFTVPGAVVVAPDHRYLGNSSVYRFEVGAQPEILAEFRKDPEAVLGAFRNEQSFWTARMKAAGKLAYWPDNWCVSFKHDCLPRWPTNYLRVPSPPPGTRIVMFHGNPKPEQAIAGFRSFHRFTRPTPWVAAHWR